MWSTLVSNPRRGIQVLGLAILTLGTGAMMLPSLGRMAERDVDVVELELMGTSSEAVRLVAQLGSEGVDAARMSLYLDYPFLVAYGLLLSAACVVLAARAAERGAANLAALGRLIAWAAPVAAAFDAVENAALLVVLGGSTEQPWPGVAFAFASAKFVLLAAVVGYLVLTTAVLFRRTPAPKPSAS